MAAPPIVFLFSGQGSHYYHMARELYERHPPFRTHLLALDGAARDTLRFSIIERCYDDRHKKTDRFDDTLSTHPAIFIVELALARTLIDAGIVPDYVLGASLGTFAAAVIAGYLTAEAALAAVIEQARAIEAECPAGGMIAVLDRPDLHAAQAPLSAHSEIASFNFPTHFVIAARHDRLGLIETHLGAAGVTFQALPVSRAFHSSWIDGARARYCRFAQSLALAPPTLPLVCSVDATLAPVITPEYFWTVAREPIRFAQTIAELERRQPLRYIDVGPAGTLATFVKYNLASRSSASEVYSILTPFGQDLKNWESLKARLRAGGI